MEKVEQLDFATASSTAQAKEGHARGSWHFNGDHGAASGGRLYSTALAAMTLEVYYRYMPIYKSKSIEDRIE